MKTIKPGATHVNASYVDGTLFNSGTEEECMKYMIEYPHEMAAIMTREHYFNPDFPKNEGHWSDCHGNSGTFSWN